MRSTGFSQLLAALGVLILCVASALATDRYYRDITATSSNGRYRLEATSPGNRESLRPFAENFTYILTDIRGQKRLWTYQQQKEASPVAVWVHESGWVVVRTGLDELLAFDPSTGKVTGKVAILDQFPDAEKQKFVDQTTAGPRWSQSSRWCFTDIDGKLNFVVRAYWGRRVIMEIATGTLIANVGKVKASMDKEDKEWIVATLGRNVPLLLAGDGDHANIWDTWAAIDMAVTDGIQEAVPFLREAEKSEYIGSSSTIPIFLGADAIPKGELDPFAYSQYTIRYKAQTALRKLGQTPAELPAIGFQPVGQYKAASIIKVTPTKPRSAALPMVHAGQTPMEVLQAAGGPDRIHREGREIAWEYHVDGQNAHSVEVFWTQSAPPVVAKIENITPPTWKGEEDVD